MTELSRAVLVAEARRWIGTPYAHQASLIHVGCDCLGLVRGVWRGVIGAEPEAMTPYAPAWSLSSSRETLLDAARRHLVEIASRYAREGDVLLFRWRDGLPAAHAAILAASQSFIHAHDGAAVAEVHFSQWWRRHLVAAFSFPGATG
ncbi:NlpC/P60 family protein [Terrarubrum flagellatum]|uniref:NlpC/P60 family protein n=1 Tax=Terrirubrum flagellatum TaxID=2895980 RepID=UPI0031456C1E